MTKLSGRLLHPQILSNAVLIFALIALAGFYASQSSIFLSFSNVVTLANNAAALGIIVVPFAMLVISGNVDFSVGSTAGLAATVTAISVTQWGVPEGLGLLLALLVGLVVGIINGTLCVVLGFNPIIVTLGMLSILRGLTLLIQTDQIYGIGPITVGLRSSNLAGLPLTLLLTIAVFLLGAVFLVVTPSGRHLYAIGVNRQAAFLSALPVRALPFMLYVLTGLGASIAGIVLMTRLNGVSPAGTGVNLEFQALTIVLLGGVAFAGGRGSLLGVFVAWLFLATLNNGLTLLNVPPFIQTVAYGLALAVAAALDRFGSGIVPLLRTRRAALRRAEQTGT